MKIRLDKQNIFFCSDLHENHANVIKYDNRPFKDVSHMNAELIRRWNNKVGVNDTVFYLGDLTFRKDIEEIKIFVNQLNGKIHFIYGNHDDDRIITKLNRFETISDYVTLSILDKDSPRKYQDIMLSHYAILSWDKSHHGSWHLHGHSHQSLVKPNPEYYKRKVIDIGCNGWDYEPLSYNEKKNNV
jgi:calcineurin-like phosphoesterase family protein